VVTIRINHAAEGARTALVHGCSNAIHQKSSSNASPALIPMAGEVGNSLLFEGDTK